MKNKSLILSLFILTLLFTSVNLLAQEEETTLMADKLIVDDMNSEIIATGNVVLDRDNLKLTSNKLTANQNLGEIKATGEVLVKQEGSKLTGQELTLNNKSKQGVLTGNPKMENEGATITGNRFEFNLDTNKLFVYGGAHIVDESQDLIADAEEMEYNDVSQEVILTGNVYAKRGTQTVNAEEVIINLKTRKMIAKGKTKFVIPSDEKGD